MCFGLDKRSVADPINCMDPKNIAFYDRCVLNPINVALYGNVQFYFVKNHIFVGAFSP